MPRRTAFVAAVLALVLAGCQTFPATSEAGGCKPLPSAASVRASIVDLSTVTGDEMGRQAADNQGTSTHGGALSGVLADELAADFSAGELGLEHQSDGSVRLQVPARALFAGGSDRLSATARDALAPVAGTLRNYCGVTAHVIGHTDSVGRRLDNLRLSVWRARSVVDHLVSQGVDRQRLISSGLANDRPLAAETDDAGRQRNRRVEIVLRPPV